MRTFLIPGWSLRLEFLHSPVASGQKVGQALGLRRALSPPLGGRGFSLCYWSFLPLTNVFRNLSTTSCGTLAETFTTLPCCCTSMLS